MAKLGFIPTEKLGVEFLLIITLFWLKVLLKFWAFRKCLSNSNEKFSPILVATLQLKACDLAILGIEILMIFDFIFKSALRRSVVKQLSGIVKDRGNSRFLFPEVLFWRLFIMHSLLQDSPTPIKLESKIALPLLLFPTGISKARPYTFTSFLLF